MSRIVLALVVGLLTACGAGTSPELRVLGVHDTARREVVFVQVTNPASRPMHLTRLEYTFAAAGTTLTQGQVQIEREVPAGATAIVEVPFDAESSKPMTLKGRLVATLDEIVRIFQVDAQIQPH